MVKGSGSGKLQTAGVFRLSESSQILSLTEGRLIGYAGPVHVLEIGTMICAKRS